MGGWGDDDEPVEKDSADDPLFSILIDPEQLEKMDIIWAVVLESEVPEVYNAAIKFLIYTHMSLDDDLADNRALITQKLITQCFELMKDNPEDSKINRVVEILMTIIQISERKGTGDVYPHNAILPGETLDRIHIRNNATKADNIIVKATTGATVWEFKKEVSMMLGLSPRYTQFELPGRKKITDKQHGMVL